MTDPTTDSLNDSKTDTTTYPKTISKKSKFVKRRDPKSQKGPYRDPVSKIGTRLGTVHNNLYDYYNYLLWRSHLKNHM